MASEKLNESTTTVERVYIGRLLEQGHAPYNHNSEERMNYFVKLETDSGEKTIWGIDLERAMKDSDVQRGDALQLIYQGNEPVTVTAWERDKDGKIIGKREVQTHRNIWEVQKTEPFKVIETDATALDKGTSPKQQVTQTVPTSARIGSAVNIHEAHLFAALAEYEHRIGETLKMPYGEYTYLGNNGKGGVRLAFLPNSGPLDQIGQYADADHLRVHLERDIPAQKDREAVSAFFMLSEMDAAQSKEKTQNKEQPEMIEEPLKETNIENLNKPKDEDNTIQPAPAQETQAGTQNNAFVRLSSTDNAPAQPVITAPQQAKHNPKTILNGRFIRGEKGEYRRLTETRVALVDEKDKIRFVDKQIDTFQAAIELANSKGWQAILVTGTEQFRCEAWYRASLAGLKVVGYEATEKDLETLAKAQEQRMSDKDVLDKAGSTSAYLRSESLADAEKYALQSGGGIQLPNIKNGRYAGKIIYETDHHMVQDIGRRISVVHDKLCFDSAKLKKWMTRSANLHVQYEKGKATLGAHRERSHVRTH